jgi:phage protein D
MVFGVFQPHVQPAECIIRIGGEPIRDVYRFVTEVVVDATRGRFAEATISFFSPVDESDRWLIADDPRFQTWSDVVIEADFQDATEEIMRGVILNVEASYPSDAGGATFTMTCRDDSARLAREERRRAWGELPIGTTDGVILQTLAGEAGLAVDPASGPGLSNLVLTQNSSDIAFLQSRANANGYELIFGGGRIYFGPLRLALQSQPTIMVYAGQATNCRSFVARNRGELRRKIAYARRDQNGDPGSPVVVEADLPLMGLEPAQGRGTGLREHIGYLGRDSVADDAQSEAVARGLANEGDLNVLAEGELDGTLYGHVLRVGEPVQVDGVGERCSGTYYVDSVTHRFDVGGYDQRFTLLRNALGRAPGGGRAGTLAALL